MKNFLKSKFATVVLGAAFIAAGFFTVQILTQKYRIDRQIAQLEARSQQISGQNQELSDLINYLNTDQYKEKAAREQLNLKKDGEIVVSLPQQDEQIASASASAAPLGNPEKWYNYFFRHE